VAPGTRVMRLTVVVAERVAGAPIPACRAFTSDTPGYPNRVHEALEVFMKSIGTTVAPAVPWLVPSEIFSSPVVQARAPLVPEDPVDEPAAGVPEDPVDEPAAEVPDPAAGVVDVVVPAAAPDPPAVEGDPEAGATELEASELHPTARKPATARAAPVSNVRRACAIFVIS
jgi:hypothetical protein